MNKKYSWVYIMLNKNNSVIYVGVTSALENRIYKHKNNIFKGFSSKYNINKLVYYEVFEDINAAIGREKNIKNWKREWKFDLIKEKNPNYIDLCNNEGFLIDFRYNFESDSGLNPE